MTIDEAWRLPLSQRIQYIDSVRNKDREAFQKQVEINLQNQPIGIAAIATGAISLLAVPVSIIAAFTISPIAILGLTATPAVAVCSYVASKALLSYQETHYQTVSLHWAIEIYRREQANAQARAT
jgi:hypothetical protein